MSAGARQPKFANNRKGPSAEPARRTPAWTGARASPTFSPPNSGTPRSGGTPVSNQATNFPPLNGVAAKANEDKTLQSLAGLTGSMITLVTKTSLHYEGEIASTSAEGDTTGVTLTAVRDLSNPGAPAKDTLFIASTNIASWTSGPADAKPVNGDTFRTDTDISRKSGPAARERELVAWQAPSSTGTSSGGLGDDTTFGPSNSTERWDQFTANEKLFGITPVFDESAYTTTIDRNQPGFQERERKAAKLASEIMSGQTSNPHIAEERGQTTGVGEDEEEKYGAVIRGNGAYVPPGARKPGATGGAEIPVVSVNAPPQSPQPSKTSSPSPSPNPGAANQPADPVPAFRDFVTNEKQRLTQKRHMMMKSDMDKRVAELVKFSRDFKLNKPIPEDLVPILAKDEDKQKAIRDKASKDAGSNQARNIGPPTATSTVIPGQRAAPAGKGLEAGKKAPATPSGAKTTTPAAPASAAVGQKPGAATTKPGDNKAKSSMTIQAIPPFRPKGAASATPATPARTPNGNVPTPASEKQASSSNQSHNNHNNNNNTRLNVAASSFRPNPKASAFTPGGANGPNPISPKPGAKEPQSHSQGPPNPFFGTRQLKKTAPVNVKDDFNPFKHNKVVDSSAIAALWPYNGKRYIQMFPVAQHPQPQQLHSPHIPVGVVPGVSVPGGPMAQGAPVGVPGMQPPPGTIPPPPSYEEDQAQAQARGAYMYYPPYAYHPMMQGGPPPGPPGAFIPAGYMQPMPYPPGMPPNAMYAPPGMQMPPPQAYMPPPPPPPGTYPTPQNGGPRQSMPPTPIPAHAQAHPYYHSPQLQHAIPYQMMMPPPSAIPPHPYDGNSAPPVQMGGHS